MGESPNKRNDRRGREREMLQWAFESAGRNPLSWRASADDLLSAANAVKEKVLDLGPMMHSLAAVQAMLLGLALECLLKGMWIKKHRAWLAQHKGFSLTKSGKYVGIPGAGDHELRQLADAAEWEMSAQEAALLERLTGFVKYAGRYPIPTTSEKIKAQRTGGGVQVSPRFVTATELRLAERMATRLMREVLPWK
jgi:hypothetical protein